MQRREANWKLLRHPVPTACPWPVWAEGCPSAQTMVEETALAAFPSCSLGSQESTQARARFSSWIHMKHPCADCSLPPCWALGTGVEVELTRGTEGLNPSAAAGLEHNAGQTKSGAVFAAFPEPFTAPAWSPFPLFRSLLTCSSLSSADRPQSPVAGS